LGWVKKSKAAEIVGRVQPKSTGNSPHASTISLFQAKRSTIKLFLALYGDPTARNYPTNVAAG
jgi:hypothetical protein